MQYQKVGESTSTAGTQSTDQTNSTNLNRQNMFYLGAVLGVIGVLIFPFFFFLVAMPESIYKMRGSTMQKYLPKDAQENPAVSGSLLIFGWFGNFLWLIVVLGVLIVLLAAII
ncbi:hypothetical protein [Halorussus halophilus]|uniref:hypothetical protein n=1 Tax=Halorussus halophilus TaxID=2650975 RepID=UPI001300E691|nr:hypothetical protein [Halorussus halophilus]